MCKQERNCTDRLKEGSMGNSFSSLFDRSSLCFTNAMLKLFHPHCPSSRRVETSHALWRGAYINEGGIGIFGFDRFFGFCLKRRRFFGFGVQCGLRIFLFLASGFRFS